MLNQKSLEYVQTSTISIILLITLTVIMASVPTVYFLSILFEIEYSDFLFYVSMFLPLLLTPPAIYRVLSLVKGINYFKKELEAEIQKNKKRDLILFEQARFIIMGEMLANISHQWKQPLNTVSLAVVAVKTSNKSPEEMDKYFDIMEDNISYLASTIDDFMSFFDKKTHLEKRSLESIVKEIDSIVSTSLKSKEIELNIRIDESYGEVKVASSISQVILNLVNNAKDAINSDSLKKEIEILFITNKEGLKIECCDSGKGIAKEIKEKIFDPYFTTKEKSQGTGIGLHMSKEIIQKVFDGQINVSLYHKPKRTCFYITLPYSSQCILAEDLQ